MSKKLREGCRKVQLAQVFLIPNLGVLYSRNVDSGWGVRNPGGRPRIAVFSRARRKIFLGGGTKKVTSEASKSSIGGVEKFNRRDRKNDSKDRKYQSE